MKRVLSVSPMLLCILYVLFPLCKIAGAVSGYKFALRSDSIGIAVLAAVSGIAAGFLIFREPPLSKAQRVFSALLPSLSAVSGLFFILDGKWKASVVFALVCYVCSVVILWKSTCRFALKFLSTAFSAFFAVAFLFSAWISLVFGDLGVKTVVKSLASPQGAYTAEVIDSNQGALGGDTHVNVWRNGEKIDLFFCSIKKSPLRVYTGDWGEFKTMRILWKDERTLVINGREYPVST